MRFLASSVSPFRWRMALVILALQLAMASGNAGAVTFALDTEFDTGEVGQFATVEISEEGGNLAFLVLLDLDVLGMDSDLHLLYFNLEGDITGLMISDTDAPNTEYALSSDPAVAGGAGSSFDWSVEFGNGGGANGNGKLTSASFVLSADQGLSIDDLMSSSFASGGTIQIDMAAHVQGTSAFAGATSETVGGVIPIPEPSTGLLLLSGLTFLTRRSRAERN